MAVAGTTHISTRLMGITAGVTEQGRLRQKEDLFFEKKKQKTFARWGIWRRSKLAACAKEKKFSGSFFKKEHTFFTGPSLGA
jgi:hypothetical protein